jgi:hypothetical protein
MPVPEESSAGTVGQLTQLTLKELQTRAEEAGIPEDDIDEAGDSTNPKAALAALLERHAPTESEKDAELAQKLGQLQPFLAVFPQECTAQLVSFGST